MDIVIKYKNLLSISGIIVTSLFMYYGYVQHMIIHFILLPYLITKSLIFIENSDIHESDESNNYIRMWICYCSYIFVERFTDIIFPYTPLAFPYYTFKMLVLYWILKNPNNYENFYNYTVKPFYTSHKEDIDENLINFENEYIKHKNNIEMTVSSYTKSVIVSIGHVLDDIQNFILRTKILTPNNN